MKIKSILCALLLMISSVASAQYLNVKMEDGTYRSFKTTPNMKVSFGDKAGAEVTEYAQILTVGGHTVAVKLADNTPTIAVSLFAYADEDFVKIKAWSAMNVALKCTRDDGVAVSAPETSGDFQIYTISDITKDVVVTVEYASWVEGNTINGYPCVRLAGLYWATENVEGSGGGYSPEYHDDTYGDYYQQEIDIALMAAQSWGEEGNHRWTLPSEKQWQALLDNCKCTWTGSYDYKGKQLKGLLVEGKKENGEEGNSIFLPAAGIYDVGDDIVNDQGFRGYYWSADDERYLDFYNGFWDLDHNFPVKGMSVRPVSE